MISIGCDLEDSAAAMALAEAHESIHCTVGIHPCYVTDISSANYLGQLRQFTAHEKVVAIGEIGLDYFHPAPGGHTENSYRSLQRDVFTRQLELAVELGLNVVIHQRDRDTENLPCWQDLLRIIEPFEGKLRAVFHCFVHGPEEAEKVLRQGHLVSFTGVATYQSATETQATAAAVEAGQFMLETDAPYLTPVPHRGKRCEPAHTLDTARHIAGLRQQCVGSLAEETSRVAREFFGIDDCL